MPDLMLHLLRLRRFFLLTLGSLWLFFPVAARQTLQAEKLVDRADSAIEAGALDVAEIFTRQAIDLVRRDKNTHLEAKYLINLISIKIEQENSINIDEWYDRALAIIERQKDDVLLANLWNIRARQLMYNQKYEEARIFYAKTGEVYEPLGDDPVVAYYYNDLGYLEEAEGNPEKAAAWYLKAIRIFEQINDMSGLANTLGNISNTYFNLNEPEKALDYARQSLNIRKQTGDKEGIAIVLGNITRIYLNREQMDSARYYQDAYIHYAQQSGKKKTLCDSYVNLAIMHHAGKRYTLAVEQIRNAIRIGKEINHPNLANFYRMCALFLGKLDYTEQMNHYYDSAYTRILEHNNKTQFRDYYATRMHYFRSKGDYKNAFENYEKYAAYKDSVLNESVKKQVAQLEIQYETQKKNAQLESAKAAKARQQLYYNILLSVLILGLLSALFLFNRYKYRKKLEQKNMLLSERNRISAELHDEVGSALSAINLISHAAIQSGTKNEQQVRHYFSSIYTNSEKMMDTISDIVWSMHPDNDQMPRIIARMKTFAAEILEAVDVAWHFDLDDQVKALNLSGEKRRDFYLVFKEAVNNIARYAGATLVYIQVQKQADRIVLLVRDNGGGFDPDKELTGNGLNNMRRRAEKHKGSFRVDSSPGKGTMITWSMPYAS